MKTVATIMQLTRGLLILTPAEYDKPEGGIGGKRRGGNTPSNFGVPQIFELNDSLKDHPYEKSEELAAFVKRCAESVGMQLGDMFLCIEDEEILITKEYKHHYESKDKLLVTYAHVEAEAVLHQEVEKYTILNFEYGQQYGKANKTEDVSASLFAMNTGLLTDIRANFSAAGLKIVKVTPPIAGMLYTAKSDMNSATRAIAVISMDFAATRLVVLRNGAPVFQQSFASVLEDIAEMLMLEFGISKLGAIDLIQQEGLGVCNKVNNAATRKQTIAMLENSAGEIVRNLRMVISTLRMDIDLIVLCDALAKLPNITQFCKQKGLTAPMEKVSNLFSGDSRPPMVTQSAQQRGYDSTSFITLNGVLTMPMGEANLLQGETNILSSMAKSSGNKLGNLIAGALAFVAAVWMIAISGWWIALQIQQNNDENTLKDERFKYAENLIRREKKYKELTDNMATNLTILPTTKFKMSTIVDHIYKEIIDKTISCDGFTLVKTTNSQWSEEFDEYVSFSLNYVVKNYDAFVTLRDKIVNGEFFDVKEALTVAREEKYDEGAAKAVYNVAMSFSVTEKGLTACKLTQKEQEALDAKLEGKTIPESRQTSETEESSDSKQTSESSKESSPSNDQSSGA